MGLVLAVVAATAPFAAVDGLAFRCGVMSFLGKDWACRQSCKALGHTTGACEGTDGSECKCSEETGGIADVFGKIKEKFEEFGEQVGDEVNSWEITQDVKGLVNIAHICTTSCHAIG